MSNLVALPARSGAFASGGLFSLVFLGLLSLRLINVFSVQTFFQPDEYFQALEPAWKVAFGPDSGAWITWEWREHLRSAMHPSIFTLAYQVANRLAESVQATPRVRSHILIAAPGLLQAIIAAIGDLFTWLLACKIFTTQAPVSWAALSLTVFSPWQWYCSVRTFSNTLESTLTVVALTLWPWELFLSQFNDRIDPKFRPERRQNVAEMVNEFRNFLESGEPKRASEVPPVSERLPSQGALRHEPGLLIYALVAAALACLLRPTNVLIWASIIMTLLYRYGDVRKAVFLAGKVLTVGGSTLALSIAVDWQFYGKWSFPPLKFIYFNLVQNLSVFYGRNRHDYYFTEGLPLLLTTALPFAVMGMWQALRPGPDRPSFPGYTERQVCFVLAIAVIVVVVAMSLIAHKEVRFIYPLLPILHVLAAKPFAAFFEPFPLPKGKARLGLLMLMLSVNVYIAAYVSFVHQRGVIDVMHFLRHQYENEALQRKTQLQPPDRLTVGFLMPCHSTPWRSHLVHPKIEAWALTCEPPLNLSAEDRHEYMDEADLFYAHPAMWIHENMQDRGTIALESIGPYVTGTVDRRPWPQYLAFFEQLEPVMSRVLEDSRYKECWRGFNTHWHDDWRRQGDVILWCYHESKYDAQVERDEQR